MLSPTKYSAAPCGSFPLDAWIDDDVMQAVAAGNNVSEIAFLLQMLPDTIFAGLPPTRSRTLRPCDVWSAFLVFEHLAPGTKTVRFQTRSGKLKVSRQDDRLFLNVLAYPGRTVDCPPALADGFWSASVEVLEGPNYMAAFVSEADIAGLVPDVDAIAALHPRDAGDFVSRFSAHPSAYPKTRLPVRPIAS